MDSFRMNAESARRSSRGLDMGMKATGVDRRALNAREW